MAGLEPAKSLGLDAPTALHFLSTIESYIVGFALWEAGTAPFRSDPAYSAPIEPWQLPPGANPYLVELAPQLARTSCDESFEFGLDLIIAGLQRRLRGG